MSSDLWEFLPADDELSEPRPLRGAEEAALHVEPPRRSPGQDPSRSDVETALLSEPDLGAPASYFSDEEPEFHRDGGDSRDEVNDVETLLENQHYAFSSDDEEEEQDEAAQ